MEIASSSPNHPVRSGQRIASFDANALKTVGDQPVELVLDGVRKTASSLVLRLSLSTDSSKPIVAGNLYTLGEGSPEGPDERGRFFPLTLSLDVTKAMRRLAGPGRLHVHLDLLDNHGQTVTGEQLSVENVRLRTIEPE